jgi:hypothetical protein
MNAPRARSDVILFAGRFGSGKTETAINYALALTRAEGLAPSARPVVLIDLDIVTPYFRSRETAEQMQRQGVDVVAPASIGQHLDTPAITPEILGAIERTGSLVVLDVGGDQQGARALGQFRHAIRKRGYTMHFVVNPYRPFTDTLEGLAASIAEIEASARLQVTSLVSNPNLMGETSADQISEGHARIEAFAQELGLPIAFLCLERRWAIEFGYDGAHLPLASLEKEGSGRHLKAHLEQNRPNLDARVPFAQPVLALDRHFAMSWE